MVDNYKQQKDTFLRWPTTVKAKSISPRQINLLTAKSIYSRQNQFAYSKINLLTAKSISPRQNQNG